MEKRKKFIKIELFKLTRINNDFLIETPSTLAHCLTLAIRVLPIVRLVAGLTASLVSLHSSRPARWSLDDGQQNVLSNYGECKFEKNG